MSSPSDRDDFAAILDKALEISGSLHDYTNRTFAVSRASPATLAMVLLGERTLRTLRAVRQLASDTLDDRVAVLARSAAEGAIDAEYLSRDTARQTKNAEVPLGVAFKAELFFTHHPIAGARLFPETAMSPSRELMEARKIRAERGLGTNSPYWHCASTKALCTELKALGDADLSVLVDHLYNMFGFLSTHAHAHPHGPPYFDFDQALPSGLRLTQGFRDDTMIGLATMVGLHSIVLWANRLAFPRSDALAPLATEATVVLRRIWPKESPAV